MNPVISLSNTWNPRQYSSGSPGSRNPPGRFRIFWKESKSTVHITDTHTSSLAQCHVMPSPLMLPPPPSSLTILNNNKIKQTKKGRKEWVSLQHACGDRTYNHPQPPSPTRVSPPTWDSARMRGGGRRAIGGRRARCRACRRGRRLLCSLLMPVLEKGFGY